jgi:small conductance mechanosensitive channel
MDNETLMWLQTGALAFAQKLVIAIVILIVGRILAGIIRKFIKRLMQKSEVDQDLRNFLGNLIYYLILIAAVVAAIGQIGVETASIVAILAAAGFAIGFALQGSLSNFASGVMLLFFRPFKSGDFVETAGVAGVVQEIGIFCTTIHTPDNVRIIVPNSTVYGDTIKNYSANEQRRVDLLVGIGYDSSIDLARQVLQEIIQADQRIKSDPEPQVVVSELADSSVNFTVRVWTETGDYWGVKFSRTEKIKKEFDAKDIEIPFPQQVVQ